MERPGDIRCPHIWPHLGELVAERMAARALRGGIEVTPPSAPLVNAHALSGIRLAWALPPARRGAGLGTIAHLLDSENSDAVSGVV